MLPGESGWFKTNVLGELPFIGGFFRASKCKRKMVLLGQSAIEFSAATAAMILLPMPEEQIEDKFAKSTTAMVLGQLAGVTYQASLTGVVKLHQWYLKQKSFCSVGRPLAGSFADASFTEDADSEDDEVEYYPPAKKCCDNCCDKCQDNLRALGKAAFEITAASCSVGGAMLIPMSLSPEERAVALITLGMFGKTVGGVANNLVRKISCCPSRNTHKGTIVLQTSEGIPPVGAEELGHHTTREERNSLSSVPGTEDDTAAPYDCGTSPVSVYFSQNGY